MKTILIAEPLRYSFSNITIPAIGKMSRTYFQHQAICAVVLLVLVIATPAFGGMILDLGAESDYIQVTPEYSNAVLVALLPYFSDFAKKLDLPVPCPIIQEDVADFRVLPFRRNPGASIRLKNGLAFSFLFGYVDSFASAHEIEVADSHRATSNYGDVKITPGDAVAAAKQMLNKLDIPLEDVYANWEPKVSLPIVKGTNAIYPYRVEWMGPFGGDAVDAKVNPITGNVEKLDLRSPNLAHSAPKIKVVPPPRPNSPPRTINPEYARRLLPIMFKAIDDYAEKLFLSIPFPLNTNNVARVSIQDDIGSPYCEVETTNGWLFIYRHAMVSGYYSPNAFDRLGSPPLHVKDFEGKWNLTTNQAIEIVRQGLAKLNYPTNNVHMNFDPIITYASGDFRKIIPRYSFEWNYPSPQEVSLSEITAEVNADNGVLESLYYDDEAYWNSRPPIDVPVLSGKYPAHPQ